MIQANISFLGWEVQCYFFFNPEDSKAKITPPSHFGGGKQHVAFEVSNSEYEAVKMEIKSKGIPLVDEVVWKSGEESFYFEDPEGNILEILPDKGLGLNVKTCLNLCNNLL